MASLPAHHRIVVPIDDDGRRIYPTRQIGKHQAQLVDQSYDNLNRFPVAGKSTVHNRLLQ